MNKAIQKAARRQIPRKSPVHRALQGIVECSDCLSFMHDLVEESCDLIYVDLPFGPQPSGLQQAVSGRVKEPFEYIGYLRPRLAEMRRLLSSHGSIYVHLDWRWVHYVKVMLDEVFGARQFLNEIIWSYRSGSRPGPWFARKHDSILLYAKQTGRHTFHRLRGGNYRTRDLRTADDGRPFKSTRSGPIYFHPGGPAISDVWDIPFLSTVSKERVGYPSQKPVALLERVIRASSDEGSLVADFFCGSGTTLVAAKRLGRRWLGCDINPMAVNLARERLSSVEVPIPVTAGHTSTEPFARRESRRHE